ncbi:tRNA lysidine(34) synthetase TilS [Comamonas jiangduensis]|uniref:tRNA lysidine(34) synthetase TilS n=1 Tax=Comamonas jiangduensis TaxID=1194168 RepID=UPI0028A7C757|nr:tRNA lysidine(34) synthetase TilS [Comamonas jiangduensis]
MTVSVDQALQVFAPALPLAVAYSGGADSTALLHACAQRWPGQVVAIHVHHGLQAAADGFAAHCRASCAALQVPLAVAHVDARPGAGQSPEEAARHHRYSALVEQARSAFAHPVPSIALAQHADDQVETLLLALSRGAGVAGLAAMPAQWQRDGMDWYRPLLRVSAPDIRAWLKAHHIAWVEDPTNTDPSYTRNRIRAQLLPVLEQVFPQFRDTFARSSAHAAHAKQLQQDLAQADLQVVGVPPNIQALQQLSAERQANVLRHWLLHFHQTTPSAAQLQELLKLIAACRTRGHHIHLKVGYGFAVRKGANLGWYNP